jgi:hypothetical protein
VSDGEIWTGHGGVNPCGLVVRRGDRELKTRWLCLCSIRKLRRDTRTRRFYTGSGLRRVKPYVQFFGLYCFRGEITRQPVPGRTPLHALYWVTDKVGGPESKSVTTEKPISSQLQHEKLIRAALIRLDFLVLHAKLSSRLWNLLEGLQEVVWATN